MSQLRLNFDCKFGDLYTTEGLQKLDKAFLFFLQEKNQDIYDILLNLRIKNELLAKDESNFLIDLAPFVEEFIASLFSIYNEVGQLRDKHKRLDNLYSCKRLFVQRQATKKYKETESITFNGQQLQKELEQYFGANLTEDFFAAYVNKWLEEKEKNAEKIDVAMRYAAWAVYSYEGKKLHKDGILFKVPKKLDLANLVETSTNIDENNQVKSLAFDKLHQRYRDGFKLTDKGGTLKQALDDANYCINCHNQGKDSCAKGFKLKDNNDYKISELDVKLAGCPLEEKISEMHLLKTAAYPIAALAMITVDNPLCAATGYRICNDCMKSCIYQKQEPVNIPRSETRILQDVLELPWGFEIYSLLTRWNPLNIERPLPKLDSGYKILVAGLGPAGFNLSHHLLNEGHVVVAIDGLKIEPLDKNISGVNEFGKTVKFKPIKNIHSIFEELDERERAGFGGVAEYGITVRWNKNFLKVIRLLLERRTNFAMYGGVRFGGTITYDDAVKYGFDHIALCIGAGRPTVINIQNALARGVRTASDFLMGLQLTGAAKKDSLANMQVRLPVIVIGGGLTAIDTATESLAYYPVQVEKFLKRYETLADKFGVAQVRKNWTEEETEIADEFISHATAIRLEREKARIHGNDPDIVSLIKQWGGVKIAYRRRLQDSPSYRLNHEEVEKAFEEGIEFIENATPVKVVTNDNNHTVALQVSIKENDDTQIKSLPAKTIYMAAGTNPNTILTREDNKHFGLDDKNFIAVDENGVKVKPEYNISKPNKAEILIYKGKNNKFVSCFGDVHPSFVGNVVKAMGSAKQGYPIISRILKKSKPASNKSVTEFFAKMNDELIAIVHKVERLTPTIIEVIAYAPAAARGFQPGQFYRLQNYNRNAIRVVDNLNNATTLGMEGLALTGAWVDREKGLLSTIVLEMGGSSNLCYKLKKGEPIILMGPTGSPTEIVSGKTVMLIGGGLGNAVLFSIGKALKQAGSKVLYFAGYRKAEDRYKVEEIEAASDKVIWACDEATFTPERAGDAAFHGNIVEAIKAYGQGLLGREDIKLSDVDKIICIGSDKMMAAVAKARHGVLKHMLNPNHKAIGSINSPMQCMMKEICAQCLQRHVDPETGKESYVYSCFNQDQKLDYVDFNHLSERLKQNTVQEKLTAKWIDYCLSNEENNYKLLAVSS